MNAFRFDAETHTYTLGGRRLPSATQVIQALLPMPPVDEWYLQRGTATHHGCRLLDDGRLDWSTVDAEIEPRIRAWQKFRREWPAKLVANEQPLVHARLGYAGTVDRVFRDPGGLNPGGLLTICDLKNSVSPQVYLQMAAYSLLWAANDGGTCQQAVAVELTEDATYRCHWMSRAELRRAEQQWLALLTVYGFAETHNLLRNRK